MPELLFSKIEKLSISARVLSDFDRHRKINIRTGLSFQVIERAAQSHIHFVELDKSIMDDSAVGSVSGRHQVEVSIQIDSELLEQIQHLTNEPSKVIETAIRQWLRGETHRDDELSRRLQRNPPVPPRGEWND